MRVLELLSSAWWTGPAEPMASVARALAARGHAVEIAVETLRPGNLVERLRAEGLAVRDDLALSSKSGPIRYLRDVRRLGALARGGVDVLHANFSHDHVLALLAARAGGPARVVRTVHAARALARGGAQGVAFRRTDGLVAVCEAHARALVERFRVPEARVVATRGAVDSGAFTPEGPDLREELGIPAGAPVAGIVSRVKPGRRHEDLVDAFRAVADRLPEARLVVVGRGEGEEAIRVRVAHRGLQRNVVFAGYRSGAELAAAYRTFDAKVLLAEGNDGTCRALLEGMAAGRPGVAYRFGAPAEAIVDGATGLLVPDGDVAALADALVELLGAPARARAMGRAARERMSTAFTESARGDAIAAFLARILSLPPAGRAA
ncbi:glycosyltransferase family 4 protein [Anaeromyxobacter terrae]|uniref:glycosyltransferase family 4 protein n=1 Tax=Anaeromyxobacter terrae TaxID=2925406 RepID=UPI001F582DDC|nr:glycosyltransferase family 4 protein [Anaeromyxobacter sp. SG22]